MAETLENRVRQRVALNALKLVRRMIRGSRGQTGRTAEFLFDAPFVKLQPEKVQGCEVLSDRYEMLHHFPKGGLVAEVGTQRGHYARKMLDACAPAKLFVIDISYDLFDDKPLQKELSSGRLIKKQGRSDEALASFENESLDWIYIDAGHSYESVRKDLAIAVKKVKPDGFLVCNDYCLWSPIDMMAYGVMAAVNELCNSSDWRMRYFVMNHLSYYDVVLTRGNSQLDVSPIVRTEADPGLRTRA